MEITKEQSTAGHSPVLGGATTPAFRIQSQLASVVGHINSNMVKYSSRWLDSLQYEAYTHAHTHTHSYTHAPICS